MHDGKDRSRGVRQRRHRRGLFAETIAALLLRIKGYRIVARRFKAPVGEIDLIAIRGQHVSFVEVKYRNTVEEAEASVYAKQRTRVRRAAQFWISRQPKFEEFEQTFDLIFVFPWQLPRHLPGAL